MIGDKIKRIRERKGLTQKELATQLNVSRVAVTHWENGRTSPDVETLVRMTKLMDIKLEYFVDGVIR